MSVGREQNNDDFFIMNLVNEPMSSGNAARPYTDLVVFQLFRFSSTNLRILYDFFQQGRNFFEERFLARFLNKMNVFREFICENS